ncbi:bidirectional sugar transporter SWEET4-like [Salvia miltiorrhiza]|uniref:bidirectional sugar transporter SWEET4-like n=1 Tax=Salvia miltiorrhiza TaxID=226208 RepID=UPI0025AD240F|nr:bidirectional sugar transporter SWEET4-like [Salvia miltiorrhiza]
MISKEDARIIFGILGNVISVSLFLSPVPTFYRIWKKKAVEQYSAVPYLATFINCGLWILYGLPMVQPNSTLVLTVNGTGFVIEIFYLSLFLIYSVPKKRLRLVAAVVTECFFLAALSLCVLLLVHKPKPRADIVGSMCMAGNVFMYAAPLSVMKLVITSKSVEYMPFFLSFFSFLNGLCWTTYALMKFDAFILVPNSIGSALGLAQLVLYATFYNSTQRILAQRKMQGGEVDLAKIDAERNQNGDVVNGA